MAVRGLWRRFGLQAHDSCGSHGRRLRGHGQLLHVPDITVQGYRWTRGDGRRTKAVDKVALPPHLQKRAFWYLLECLVQDPDTRKNGAVIIADGRGIHPGMFDHKYVRWAAGMLYRFQFSGRQCIASI